ncbi:hypothetical protein IE53DRAFT_259491 [Violaceomyces palustris]|uniref:Uncharacterized protein n=1 Tax=Violaceomyces palustris TaxID=1673888 RepID=A0ACD0NN88_9BASI|nr:hypothetical protein IE53DRAFT_259491 [Violaceomyces palustris]
MQAEQHRAASSTWLWDLSRERRNPSLTTSIQANQPTWDSFSYFTPPTLHTKPIRDQCPSQARRESYIRSPHPLPSFVSRSSWLKSERGRGRRG